VGGLTATRNVYRVLVMIDFFVASVDDPSAGSVAALVVGDRVHPLPTRTTMAELLADWDAGLDGIEAMLRSGLPNGGIPLSEARLEAPVSAPPNLYMVGANYADHAREMLRLGPDDPVGRPVEGPFIFLKPTTTVIGPGATVVLPDSAARVDWEIELAAVIGRRAHRVSVDDALDHVAGYTVANDVSVRSSFRRGPESEPAMVFDWFAQKGWHTTLPLGPWLAPARRLPDPGTLTIRLTRNGQVEQDSTTAEMLFSVAEQIAYISAIVPMVPGDVVCTGTCAGVGAGSGRFLAPGDVMVAEIEGIGRLVTPVAAA
jgi:2-keto-4-pentenoate hydratase/2-oxohepta-3-ene-1,7-dioic acid hydratase in catechol pathway